MQEKMMTDYDTYLLIDSGIKGVTYETYTDSNGNTGITMIGKAGDPKSTDLPGLRTNGIGYLGGNSFNFVKKLSSPTYAWADKNATINNVGGTPYQAPVWAALPSSTKEVPAIQKNYNEAFNLFITGERQISDWDNFIQDLKKAGLDQWVKEANDWYVKNKAK